MARYRYSRQKRISKYSTEVAVGGGVRGGERRGKANEVARYRYNRL